MPSAAREGAASEMATPAGARMVSVNPSAPTSAGAATCQFRSPVQSECVPTTTIPTAATAYGIAVSRIVRAGLIVPAACRICGSQKLTP